MKEPTTKAQGLSDHERRSAKVLLIYNRGFFDRDRKTELYEARTQKNVKSSGLRPKPKSWNRKERDVYLRSYPDIFVERL